MSNDTEAPALTTPLAIEAIAWGRAPRYGGRTVNRRIVCADGFKVSVQASSMHYANDSDLSDEAPYWRSVDTEPVLPFKTFEVGYPSDDPTPPQVWAEYDSDGVWAWVPQQVVADLLNTHGGAVAWEERA